MSSFIVNGSKIASDTENIVKRALPFRAIVYGTRAEPIKVENSDHTHRWTVYVRGFHDEDISTYIKRITFKLHESFPNPLRSKLLSAIFSLYANSLLAQVINELLST